MAAAGRAGPRGDPREPRGPTHRESVPGESPDGVSARRGRLRAGPAPLPDHRLRRPPSRRHRGSRTCACPTDAGRVTHRVTQTRANSAARGRTPLGLTPDLGARRRTHSDGPGVIREQQAVGSSPTIGSLQPDRTTPVSAPTGGASPCRLPMRASGLDRPIHGGIGRRALRRCASAALVAPHTPGPVSPASTERPEGDGLPTSFGDAPADATTYRRLPRATAVG